MDIASVERYWRLKYESLVSISIRAALHPPAVATMDLEDLRNHPSVAAFSGRASSTVPEAHDSRSEVASLVDDDACAGGAAQIMRDAGHDGACDVVRGGDVAQRRGFGDLAQPLGIAALDEVGVYRRRRYLQDPDSGSQYLGQRKRERVQARLGRTIGEIAADAGQRRRRRYVDDHALGRLLQQRPETRG